MSSIAAVVLAHADPEHVRRLVTALDDVPVFLHCDLRTPAAVFEDMTRGLPHRVTVLDRLRTSLGSWSLVQAELNGVRAALASTDADHVLVMSGSDYPLVPVAELRAELDDWRDRSRMQMIPVPTWIWNTARRPDGGMWRFRYRFVVHRGNLVRVRGVPLRSPWPRRVPRELRLFASQQWKVLSRRHALALLSVLETRPDILAFWRTTYVPEESCIASILGSPDLVGELASATCNELPWLIDWTPGGDHPGWITRQHFDRLMQARYAEPRGPGHPDVRTPLNGHAGRKLIARKFSTSVDHGVLDMIDRRLRV